MGFTIGAIAIAGTSIAVQANQQKIAAQKQKDALGDAEKRQQELLDKQKAEDEARKSREEKATQAAFTRTAASRRTVSGAKLPGAVAASAAIGSVGNGQQAAKRLIGS